ncbi:MAG: hypothetical protein ACJ77M_09045 [Thermoleophilaceae bacterium]|jgi:hypothetical protein
MKERKGPLGRTVELVADTVSGTVRRRRQGRMPRALVYDGDGNSRLVAPGTEEHEKLLELADALIVLAAEERGGEPESDLAGDDPLEE